MTKLETIVFDADDTLWHTEQMFQDVQKRLYEMMADYASVEDVQAHFHDMEVKNVRLFGYGVKGFTLSMIESAIEISKRKVSAEDIHEIVMMGKQILDAPLNMFDGVEDVISEFKDRYRLFIITKGDVLDQTNKIEKSGLEQHLEKAIVVQEKDVETYARIFANNKIDPTTLMMVGNSIKSDILPILDLGGHAVHIPYHVTAHFEKVEDRVDHPRFYQLSKIIEIKGLVSGLE